MYLLECWMFLRLLAFIPRASAQSGSDMSLCDKYTTALLKDNTATNQLTIMTLVVNTIVIGNYTKPNIPGVTFPDVNGRADAINFLDGGGAIPLQHNKPSNGTSSNQYYLLTHLYQFFGTVLGCSQQASFSSSPAYSGVASQYDVHRYMALDIAQVTYFIQQIGLALLSFGFSTSDTATVGDLVDNTFNRRCSPNATVIPTAGPVQQSICVASDCIQANNPVCSSYNAVVVPGIANSTLADGLGNSSNTVTASFDGAAAPTTVANSTTAAGNSTTSAATSSSNTSSGSSSTSSGLSDAAKIGIGVGVGVGGFLVLIAIIAFFLGRRIGQNSNKKAVRSTEKPKAGLSEPGVGVEHHGPGVAVDEQR